MWNSCEAAGGEMMQELHEELYNITIYRIGLAGKKYFAGAALCRPLGISLQVVLL